MSAPAPNSGGFASRRPRPRWRGCAWWSLPLVAGAAFRLHGISDQVLADDEVHGLLAAGGLPVGRILSTLAESSFSPPLAALAHLLAGAGVPLSELSLRMPAIVTGLALLVALPVAVARRFGRATGSALAVLLAVSPLLVIHSRHARPYLPALLSTLAALAAFHAGWFERRRGLLFVAAGAGALAVWLLPVAAPAVGAPWLLTAAGIALDRPAGARARWRDWIGSAILGGALVVLAFAPAAASFERGLWSKVGRGAEPPWGDVLRLLAGTRSSLLAGALVLVAIGGWAATARRRPGFAALAAAAVATQVAVLVVARPYGWASPVVASRYLLIAVPWLLLGVALGLGAMVRRARRRLPRALASVAVALVAVALVGAGPLPDLMGPARRLLSYAQVQDYLRWPRAAGGPVPPAYRFVAGLDVDRVVVAPATAQTRFDRNFVAVASALDRDLILAIRFPRWARVREARLRTICDPNAGALLASGAGALVLHRRPDEEVRARRPFDRTIGPELAALRRRAAELERELRRRWGRPRYIDADHAVWDLRRTRGARVRDGRPRSEPKRSGR